MARDSARWALQRSEDRVAARISWTAIRNGSGDSAGVAERIVDWAENKPLQLDVVDAQSSVAIKTPDGTLFRMLRAGEIRESLHRLGSRDDWDDERVDRHVKELAATGGWAEADKPTAALDSLTDGGEDFLALMDRLLETLTD